MRTETASDRVLQVLKRRILDGWPTDRKDVPKSITPYYQFRDSLVYCNELIFRDNQIVVPESLRPKMLRKIHESHQGIVKSKQRARSVLFWPGMNHQIEDMVYKCAICQESRNKQPSEPLLSHDIPSRPWAKIAADAFYLNGHDYIVLVDYYSKFPEVLKSPDLTSHSVIQAMKQVFSRFGAPDEIVTDGASYFGSQEFKQFTQMWEFKHTTTSPGFPQSNGQAETYVKIVKNLMQKAAKAGGDP